MLGEDTLAYTLTTQSIDMKMQEDTNEVVMRVDTAQFMKKSEHMSKVYRKCSLTCCHMISVDVPMIYTHYLTRARDSVNSHVTNIHSPKICKTGKYAGRINRQLVAGEIKGSVGRWEETVRHALECVSG